MSRATITRSIRIAFSAFCGLVAILLAVLWVRSYWRCDAIRSPNHSATAILGRLMIDKQYAIESLSNEFSPQLNNDVGYSSFPVNGITITDLERGGIALPLWMPTLLFSTLSLAPWLSLKRYSLRTLLIATTLVAVILGIVLWSTR